MKVIVAGSRTITDVALVLDLVTSAGFEITELISGAARGVDSAVLMKPWACVVRKFYADWDLFGKAAGHIRNKEQGLAGEALVAIWDGTSRGTLNMIGNMTRSGKPVVTYTKGLTGWCKTTVNLDQRRDGLFGISPE